jgi:hypothetical protein
MNESKTSGKAGVGCFRRYFWQTRIPLSKWSRTCWEYRSSLAIQALRQALTPEVTPEVTPEGWVKIDEVRKYFDSVGCGTIYKTAGEDRVPLYLAPPKKEWVGLTDREIEHELTQEFAHWWNRHVSVCRAIETKLKDKNT